MSTGNVVGRARSWFIGVIGPEGNVVARLSPVIYYRHEAIAALGVLRESHERAVLIEETIERRVDNEIQPAT